MSQVPFTQRLAVNDIAGLLWLPTLVLGIFGAARLAAWFIPQLPLLPLSEAAYLGLMLVLVGGLALAACGVVVDARLARAIVEPDLPGRERLAIAGRSVSVLVSLAAWPIGASTVAIILGGYFNLALAFVLVWSSATSILFPTLWGKPEQPRS